MTFQATDGTAPLVLDRRTGPHGEVVLRRRKDTYEIIVNGCFLMDTSDGRSERLLVDAALERVTAADPAILIGGLGVGFSLAHASGQSRWSRIVVAEREDAVIGWHRAGPLSAFTATALSDPRVSVLHTDLNDHLRAPGEPYDALCLDIDNGPDWTVTDGNQSLYSPSGLAACRARLAPGGMLAIWSARPSSAFERALERAGFEDVHTQEVRVARGVPDAVHLARSPV
ncbi:spermidine synthase [Streptomyces sp. JJ38]|uniref:spermidine synthase n=1 Tax=Streptomyces sp. JJ38 TaxID=2738128 RepID=UPI001C56C693|nr:spermidine synthase [Streptomyces sp. JJ38]MBW1599198.1 spermidine synthase [Streptomyces sp. JJ38]